MLIDERHDRIIQLLIEQETVSVSELSSLFDVSPVTIRNDLNQLSEQGRAMRTHGGARLADERTRQEYTYSTRQRINAEQKQRIGHAAAQLVQPGESVFLDASTSSVAVGKAIKQRTDLLEVTVVTTGIWTALEMLGSPSIQVILSGGALRSATGSITGSIAVEVLRRFHFHHAFLGAWGLTPQDGLMDAPLIEVELKQTILPHCQEVNAVVDGSKFGRVAIASFANIHEITRIITDPSAPTAMIEDFEREGVEVIVVS